MTTADIAQTDQPRPVFALFAVPVAEYDFKEGVASIETVGEPVSLPLDQLVTFCLDDAPGCRVRVDDAADGLLLFATERWSLITPAGRMTPVVVESSRVTRLPGERKLVA